MMDWSGLSFLRDSVTSAAQPLLQLSSFFSFNQQVTPTVMDEPGGMVPVQLIEEVEDEKEGEEEQEEEEEEDERAAKSLGASIDSKKRGRAAGLEAPDDDDAPENAAEGKRSRTGELVDVTEFLMLPQSEAAARLGMTVSTFCKRWKEAVKERKWPFRSLQKLDKEIAVLRKRNPMTSATEAKIAKMLTQREGLLVPAAIRL